VSIGHFQASLQNKTTFLSRLHHRMTYSHESLRASLVLAALLSAILVGVFATKMWRDKNFRDFRAIQQKQPVQFEAHSVKSEMLVKGRKRLLLVTVTFVPFPDMIRGRARSFTRHFKKNRSGRASSLDGRRQRPMLQMEAFLLNGGQNATTLGEDEVDALHQRWLASSSSEEEPDSTDDEEEDAASVYSYDKRTGQWGRSATSSQNATSSNGGYSIVSAAIAIFSRPPRARRQRADPEDGSSVRLLSLESTSSEED